MTLRWPLGVLVSCLWQTAPPPAPWPGTRALGPSGQWRCVSVRLPVAGAPMPGSTCSRQSRAPPSAVCAVDCGQGQLCLGHRRWAVLPRGREVERLSGEGPTPRLGARVAGQVGSWLAGRCLFRATCVRCGDTCQVRCPPCSWLSLGAPWLQPLSLGAAPVRHKLADSGSHVYTDCFAHKMRDPL